ncbi:MAG: FecR domain-containing protein, partial [bacterium]
MCKRNVRWLLLATVLLVVAIAAPMRLRAIPVTASLTGISGQVQVMLPGGSWQPAKDNMALPNGTMVKTGAKSSATVKWSSQNVMKLTPFTNFTVKNIDIDPRSKTVTSNMELFSGKVKMKAEKLANPNSEFTVTTPTAVAGVRGTEADIENTAENTTNVTTRDGEMAVTAQGQTVSVPGGTTVSVNPGQAPSQPKTISKDEMNKCEDDNDCVSGKCEGGICKMEDKAMQGGACVIDGSSCNGNGNCCSKNCENGLCAPAPVAAACIPDASSCQAGTECCSGVCADGKCAPKTAAATEGTTGAATGTVTTGSASGTVTTGTGTSTTTTDANTGTTTTTTTSTDANTGAVTTTTTTTTDGETNTTDETEESTGPELIIASPPDGFTSCPYVTVSGFASPGTSVILDNIDLMKDSRTSKYPDGSFSLSNYKLMDCTKALVFIAKDSSGKETRVVVTSGATANAAAMGVKLTGLSLVLQQDGAWYGGLTTVTAKAIAKSSTPFTGAILVNFKGPNGLFYGNMTMMPISGLSSATNNAGQIDYYAQAELQIPTGPANPFTVIAEVPGLPAAQGSVVVKAYNCTPTPMIPADGIDNDCDARIGEDPIDGIDNDFDGLVDEDSPAVAASASVCQAILVKDTCWATNGCKWDNAVNKCFSAGVQCGDSIDNDRDGRIDEEALDGVDNDGDGRIDEDTMCECDTTDLYADCDFDTVLNGVDCNPFDKNVIITKSSPACAVKCDAQASPEADCDNDGLNNSEEMAVGTNPYNKDTDGDAFGDLAELESHFNPLDPASKPSNCSAHLHSDMCAIDPNCLWDAALLACKQRYEAIAPTVGGAVICIGGQVASPDGKCFCPAGMVWNAANQFCEMPSYTRCASMTYFDNATGGCVPTCTGGQLNDNTTGTCYCPDGKFLGPDGYCIAAVDCPASKGFVIDPATQACICNDAVTPFFDELQGACVAECSGGQVGDHTADYCVCPAGATGSYLDMNARKCVFTVSTTVCPSGTAGAGCDFMVSQGDCDADGLTNLTDTNPCINETGVTIGEGGEIQEFCPAGTDASGRDMKAYPDVDGDGALNEYDSCPCMFGTASNDFCPGAPTFCPEGQFLDEFYGACVTVCPAPRVADAATKKCVCQPGLVLDEMTGECTNSCPEGMALSQDGTYCVCSGSTPYMDQFTGGCVAQCAGVQIPVMDNYSNQQYCACPQGSSPSYIDGDYACVCGAGGLPDPITKECPLRPECAVTENRPIGCDCTFSEQCGPDYNN